MELKDKYPDAQKKVRAEKPKDNYILIRLSYDNHLVLPYKDGMSFLASLGNAEKLDGDYSKKRIIPFDRNQLSVEVMSNKEYERHKIAAVLNVSVTELEEYENQQTTTT